MKKTIDLLNTVVSLFFHLIYDIIYTTITEVTNYKQSRGFKKFFEL